MSEKGKRRRQMKRSRSPEAEKSSEAKRSFNAEPVVHTAKRVKKMRTYTTPTVDFISEDVEELTAQDSFEHENLVRALAWNQPSMSGKSANLPQLFYTDNPDGGIEEGEGEGEGENRGSEVHPMSPSTFPRVVPWSTRAPTVLHHIPASGSEDHCSRVRAAVGGEFPPAMGQYVELLVHRHWERWKKEGLIRSGENSRAQFHSIVVDGCVYLTNLIKGYIRLREKNPQRKDVRKCERVLELAAKELESEPTDEGSSSVPKRSIRRRGKLPRSRKRYQEKELKPSTDEVELDLSDEDAETTPSSTSDEDTHWSAGSSD